MFRPVTLVESSIKLLKCNYIAMYCHIVLYFLVLCQIAQVETVIATS